MTMKISILQVNTVVGDLVGNARRIAAGVREASRHRPDLIVAPELSLTGCPPQDLLLQAGFITRSLTVLDNLAVGIADAPPVLVGFAEPNPAGTARPLFNAAALLQDGEVRETFRKASISGVLGESRYFEPAAGRPGTFRLGERTVGVAIGEDICCGGRAPDVIVNLVASPFVAGSSRLREERLSRLAKENQVAIISANLVGGNDNLVFYGRSVAFFRRRNSHRPRCGLCRGHRDRRSRPPHPPRDRSRRPGP